jgi:hypothetical protein
VHPAVSAQQLTLISSEDDNGVLVENGGLKLLENFVDVAVDLFLGVVE